MRSFAILAAGIALASAQSITTSSVPTATGPPMGVYRTDADVPAVTATTVIASASATVLAKRDTTTCLAQPTGIAHTTSPDTDVAFLADTYYSGAALAANVPAGYTSAFTNTQASNNADPYMGFTLLSSYDVAACAAKCSAITGCASFNIYFERDPSIDPNDASCANPTSVTQVKCVWWGTVVNATVNVNNGQWRNNFHVVIAGSNGYALGVNAASSSSTTSSAVSTTSSAASTTSSVASTTSSAASTTVAPTTTSAAPATTSAAMSTFATVVKVAAVSTTTSTSASASASAFRIQVNWSGNSNVDGKYVLARGSSDTAFVSKSKASLFQFDAAGNLIDTASNTAANVWYGNSAWQRINFASLGRSTQYSSCSISSPYVTCNVNNAFQYAGICNNDGALYFGAPTNLPSGCRWIGLFPVYN